MELFPTSDWGTAPIAIFPEDNGYICLSVAYLLTSLVFTVAVYLPYSAFSIYYSFSCLSFYFSFIGRKLRKNIDT